MAQVINLLNEENIKRIFIYFLFIFQINAISCQICKNVMNLTNEDCFNHIIKFNHERWRAGHALINNNGDLIVEFSLDYQSDSRLFYGLKKNGRNYFRESVFKEIKETLCEDTCENKGRFESTNLLVSSYADSMKSKQYLFSMSSGNSLVELIDIENNLEYFAWSSTSFFNLDKPIFSFKFSLFEIDNSNTYITVFSESLGYRDGLEIANNITLQKFRIDSTASNIQTQILNSTTIDHCLVIGV